MTVHKLSFHMAEYSINRATYLFQTGNGIIVSRTTLKHQTPYVNMKSVPGVAGAIVMISD